jgi:hypothetical protein
MFKLFLLHTAVYVSCVISGLIFVVKSILARDPETTLLNLELVGVEKYYASNGVCYEVRTVRDFHLVFGVRGVNACAAGDAIWCSEEFSQAPVATQAAILEHEVGHMVYDMYDGKLSWFKQLAYHVTAPLMIIGRGMAFQMETRADAYAADAGHREELLDFLCKTARSSPAMMITLRARIGALLAI